MRKHKRKSLAREDLLLGSKKFPTYMKTNYRSQSIENIATPKNQVEKERSLDRYR